MFRDLKISYKLAIGFGIMVLCLLVSGLYSVFMVQKITDLTDMYHRHPFAVSTSVRDIDNNIIAMHRSMKDVALAEDDQQLQEAIQAVAEHEKAAFEKFDIVLERFLGDKQCIRDAKEAFANWKEIRDEVIRLTKEGKRKEAAAITKGRGAEYVKMLNGKIDFVVKFANSKANEFYSGIQEAEFNIIFGMTISFIVIVVGAVFLSIAITKSITKPISEVVHSMDQLAKGDLDIQVCVERKGEIGRLQASIVSFKSAMLEVSELADEISLGNLDVKIEKRSDNDRLVQALNNMVDNMRSVADFANQIAMGDLSVVAEKRSDNDTLTESLNTMVNSLGNAQDNLLRSEKMAVLGALISGIAHDINTPLAAIKSAKTSLESGFNIIIEECKNTSLASLHEDPILEELLNESINCKLNSINTKKKRDSRIAIEKCLNENGIDNSNMIAYTLVNVGVLEGIDKYIPILKKQECREVLDSIRLISEITTSLDVINEGVKKTENIIKALKNYIYQQNVEKKIHASVRESINDVLTLLHNKFKYMSNLTVDVDLSDTDPVECIPGKLSQVWTNLINNAIQAMGEEGKLTISLNQEGDWAIVKISDTGCGIADGIKDKIFTPLFTTKPIGQGTGLGLDICKQIVMEHGGDIVFESKVGEGTTFIVKIPVARNDEDRYEVAGQHVVEYGN